MRSLLALSNLPILLLAGCGVGVVATSDPVASPAAFQGSVHGGEAPIVYSKVSFYETATTGVATNGVYVPATPTTELGSVFTDVNGNFAFATALHCSNANDFVYAVAAGGNTGSYAGTLNANALVMAAVGSCSNFGGSTFVELNEVSSVAAGYALSGFTSISGSYVAANGTALTGVSGIGNFGTITFNVNNSLISGQPIAVTGCSSAFQGGALLNGTYTVKSASSTQIVVSGTSSALDTNCTITPVVVSSVPVVSVTASATNFTASGVGSTSAAAGLNHAFANAANLATLGRASASIPGVANTVVPSALIDTLANALQSCVNSTGGTASSAMGNDGTACGKLFSYTTDVSTTAPVVPANTLQAVLNMAHFPTQNVSNIVGLASATPAFTPAVTNTPPDLSIAIRYLAGYGASGGNGIASPLQIALDANDNVYVLNETGAYASSSTNVIAFTGTGQPLWATPVEAYSPEGISADSFGNVFVSVIPQGGIGAGFIQEYAAPSGALEQIAVNDTYSTQQYTYLANDAQGDIFAAVLGGEPHLNLFVRSGTGAGMFPVQPSGLWGGGYLIQHPLQIAQNGNVYYTHYDPNGPGQDGTSYLDGLPSTGGTSYTANEIVDYDSGTQNNDYGPGAVALDGNGVVWGASGYLVPYTPTYSSGVLNGFTAGSNIGLPTNFVNALSVDGNNAIWGAGGYYSNGGGLTRYNQTAAKPSAVALNPCVVNTQAACSGVVNLPLSVLPDATGSLWVADTSSVFQVIGAAAPSWPLLAVQKPGVMP